VTRVRYGRPRAEFDSRSVRTTFRTHHLSFLLSNGAIFPGSKAGGRGGVHYCLSSSEVGVHGGVPLLLHMSVWCGA
jgi:hypothetical protein